MAHLVASNLLLNFARDFSANRPSTAVTGEYYDLPGEIVYTTASHALPGKGRVEVNTISTTAPADFEWQHEITINDKADKRFIHLIIRRDQTAAETYGKTVLPITTGREQEIIQLLEQLLN